MRAMKSGPGPLRRYPGSGTSGEAGTNEDGRRMRTTIEQGTYPWPGGGKGAEIVTDEEHEVRVR